MLIIVEKILIYKLLEMRCYSFLNISNFSRNKFNLFIKLIINLYY